MKTDGTRGDIAADCLASAAAQAPKLPGGFVYLRDIDPTIIQDIRYAGAEQFRRPAAQRAIRPPNAW